MVEAHWDRSPLQEERDISRHAPRESDDLGVHLVAERTQLLVEELVCLLREAFERARPLRIGNVDSPAAVAAKLGRESQHLQLVLALLGSDADGPVDAVDGFGMNFARHERFAQLLMLL